MKKLIVAMVLIVFVVSIAWAATLGTRPYYRNVSVTETTWAYSGTGGLMNATGATTAYDTLDVCDKGYVKFDDITGTAFMNVALQVADRYGPPFGDTPPRDSLFTNAVGTTSEPWHQVKPGDTDTHKFDFNSRSFTVWRLNCLAGCDLTNSIATAWGRCKQEGTE